MPVTSFHWDLGKNTRLFREGGGTGSGARLDVLLNLISRSNIRLRCWPSIETIMKDTGFGKEAVSAAIQWLFDHGALFNVPHDKRVGDEKALGHRKYLYQLTGVILYDFKACETQSGLN
jgi:hypothetical protein